MHELNHRTEMTGRMEASQASEPNKQNLRLLVALCLLLVALTVVLIKDRDFWFGSEEAETNPNADVIVKTNSAVVPAQPVQAPVAQTPTTAKGRSSAKLAAHSAATQPASQIVATPAVPIVAAHRVALPPLDVEVIAGDSHRTVHSGSNVAKVEIPTDSNRSQAATSSLPANAAQRERLSAVSAPELQQTIAPAYPLLGQHSQVQGSVILQAVIGADGVIENLHVVSGPAILSAAAQQAVRQWHFKPYLQNGQPVETKTRITVNFSIRVADSSATS
jgi:TonB family protein